VDQGFKLELAIEHKPLVKMGNLYIRKEEIVFAVIVTFDNGRILRLVLKSSPVQPGVISFTEEENIVRVLDFLNQNSIEIIVQDNDLAMLNQNINSQMLSY
jgi:hypothetical protein